MQLVNINTPIRFVDTDRRHVIKYLVVGILIWENMIFQ